MGPISTFIKNKYTVPPLCPSLAFVRQLQCVDEGLQAGEVAHHFEDPHYSHDSQQANYFASLANYLQILETDEEGGDEEGHHSQQVN